MITGNVLWLFGMPQNEVVYLQTIGSSAVRGPRMCVDTKESVDIRVKQLGLSYPEANPLFMPAKSQMEDIRIAYRRVKNVKIF